MAWEETVHSRDPTYKASYRLSRQQTPSIRTPCAPAESYETYPSSPCPESWLGRDPIPSQTQKLPHLQLVPPAQAA